MPNFTAQDAIDFATAHPGKYQIVTDPARVVESIALLTAGQVNKQLNADVALPDDALVCLVKLHGTFTKQSPVGGPSISSTNGYEVFDAHTGNLVTEIILAH